MAKKSAGILLFRKTAAELEVFLVHPGGPFWMNKDEGSWSIPKGEYEDNEDPKTAALREFEEETGSAIAGEFIALDPLRQPGGKTVHAWAIRGDVDPQKIKSNTFKIEWPPKSGKQQEFPEIDRAEWFTAQRAMRKILKGQVGFITQLVEKLEAKSSTA